MESKPPHILVIKFSALGDFILALGAMEGIRRHHPDARITLLTTPAFADIASKSRYFDDIWIEKRAPLYDLPAWASLARRLNITRFARVYDLQLNTRTRILYHLFLKKPEWSGVIKGASHFYDNPGWRSMHAFTRHQEMLKLAGIDVKKPDISWMKVDVSALAPPKPYVLLIPGSAPQHPEKRWPALRYGALARKLELQGYHSVILGTHAEADVTGRIKKSCPAAIDLSGRTSLFDIATLAFDAAITVGNDTGPTHIAALAGCRTVVLFATSMSDPGRSAPLGETFIIQADDLDYVQVSHVTDMLASAKIL